MVPTAGDVPHIEERLRDLTRRKRQLPPPQLRHQRPLTEVLRENHDARTTVHRAPDDFNASSVASACVSPRADSSTSRRTPSPTASRASAPTPSAAAGEPTSDGYIRYAASASRRASAQVVGFSQSKPWARDAARTSNPAAPTA
ncbi:hypothetical protein QF037_002409 [Streptomyces canus]|nr:hypothetical protein [Streptomyces canus]